VKIWFDADNGPHVLIMRPLATELKKRGHEVIFTARDRTSTCELLDLYGFSYLKVGGQYGRGMTGKILGTLQRAASLVRAMRKESPDISFGHGSRALPIASKLLRVPSITMYDYEWVDARLFNQFCQSILLPESITKERCLAAGISAAKAVPYPGFKEELYLGGREFDQSVADDLGLSPTCVRVLVRPPATTAHYHNPEADLILDSIMAKLGKTPDVQLVFLPRTPDQRELPVKAGIKDVIIPNKVYDGPSLVACMDMVISGGGTMTREAAILGVPSYSFFRGQCGMVDEALASSGRLTLLADADAVDGELDIRKNDRQISQPNPDSLVAFICDTILNTNG